MGKFLDGAGLAHFYEKVKAYVNSHMGGGTSGGEIYSTEEVRIGTGVDGKPLYRKVTHLTLPATAGTHHYPYDFSDIEEITSVKAIIWLQSGEALQSNYYINVNDFFIAYADPRLNRISVAFGQPEAASTGYFILEYTKATDQADFGGSGAGGNIPSGGIIIWSGAENAVPSGWALCDGNNGTPDLRDRFVLGAGTDYAVGATGGEKAHTLTISEMPQHSHTYSAPAGTSSLMGSGRTPFSVYTGSTGSAGGSEAHNNMPPYYALCYIMKL